MVSLRKQIRRLGAAALGPFVSSRSHSEGLNRIEGLLRATGGELTLSVTSSRQETQKLLAFYYKDMVRRGISPLPTFGEAGFRCFSQFEEDGILLYIFSLIGSTNQIAVEIGAGNGTECNTSNLVVNHGWTAVLFDADPRNVERGRQFFKEHRDAFWWPPNFVQARVTAENVNTLLAKAELQGPVDLLVIDIDGMDYWIWKAIDCIRPRVVVVECNNVFGPDKAVTVPYEPGFRMTVPDHYGASLAAFKKLADAKEYRLVGANRFGINAFFICNGIGEDLFPAVTVESCLRHPYVEYSLKEMGAKVATLAWQTV